MPDLRPIRRLSGIACVTESLLSEPFTSSLTNHPEIKAITMERIAILSDIHANFPAFKAVLRDVRESGADQIVFLGDIVGYGASPAECVALVRELGGICVMGNHDVVIRSIRERRSGFADPDWTTCGYQAGLAHAAKQLSPDQAKWLDGLPLHQMIDGAWIAHGSFHQPGNFNYIEDAASARPTLQALQKERVNMGFFGHTHLPNIFTDDSAGLEWIDGKSVRIPSGVSCAVTVGSVGQPRHRTDRRASWVLWKPSERVVEFRVTDYDRIMAANDIVMAGLPIGSALRLLSGEEAKAFLIRSAGAGSHRGGPFRKECP